MELWEPGGGRDRGGVGALRRAPALSGWRQQEILQGGQHMCGSSENGIGIIMGLIAAAAILVFAFAEKHSGAHAIAPAQHSISAPASHIALEMRPLTL